MAQGVSWRQSWGELAAGADCEGLRTSSRVHRGSVGSLHLGNLYQPSFLYLMALLRTMRTNRTSEVEYDIIKSYFSHDQVVCWLYKSTDHPIEMERSQPTEAGVPT